MAEKSDSNGENFFTRLFSSLFRSADPEQDKKRQLKSIAKDLARSKYKFYKFGTDEALPQLAKFFYDIYKIIGPAQAMIQSTQNPNAFKNYVIEYSLSDRQKEVMENITEESILEQSKTIPLKDLSAKIKSDLTAFSSEFDTEKTASIDHIYDKLSSFIAFCTFDYYFLLKKFDSNLHERDFAYIPKFETIRAEYVSDDLKDFIAVAWALPLEEKWDDVMGLLKMVKGVEPVASGVWNKVTAKLRDLQTSGTFEMIIRLITKDPNYFCEIVKKQEHIIEPQLEKMRQQAELTIRKIEQERKNSKVDEILNYLFGTTAIVRLKSYTDTANQPYLKKGFDGYKYTQPLNYMKAFLIEYFKRNIRELADLLLIRGKWSTAALANQMSEVYHSLLEVSDKITEFDESISDESETGAKLRGLLIKSERDKEAARILRSALVDINDKAYVLLTQGIQNFVAFAKKLKSLLEDREKTAPEMLINWKELDKFAEHPIKELGVEIYKMIYQFVTLMQFFVKSE